MTTKNITVYIADDGTEFKTYEACVAHENKNKEIASIKRTLMRMRDICKSGDYECHECPFFCEDYDDCGIAGTPDSWHI